MPLLDVFNNPNLAVAAGLLSPTPNQNFGQGLLQGIGAGQGVRQNNSQDQLAQLRAQIQQQGSLSTEAGAVVAGRSSD